MRSVRSRFDSIAVDRLGATLLDGEEVADADADVDDDDDDDDRASALRGPLLWKRADDDQTVAEKSSTVDLCCMC